LEIPDGSGIPIEERDAREVTHLRDRRLTPDGVPAHNPAFDVTPNELIAAIITDRGVARAPYTDSLKRLVEGGAEAAGTS
jgi:methylthioribose-1-phosphate isomerase